MDVVSLQDATNVRLIGRAALQALDCSCLVAKRFKKGIGEAGRVKCLLV